MSPFERMDGQVYPGAKIVTVFAWDMRKMLALYEACKSFEEQEPGSSWAKVSRALMALDADE